MLSESFAIAKYLSRGTALYPDDARTRAIIDQHVGIINDLRSNLHQCFFLMVTGAKVNKLPENPEKIEAAQKGTRNLLAYYEAQLSKGGKYIASD